MVTVQFAPHPNQSDVRSRTLSLLTRRLADSEIDALEREEARLSQSFASVPVVLARSLARLRSSFDLISEVRSTLEGAYPSFASDESSKREYHRVLGELLEGMGFAILAFQEYRLAQRLGDDSLPLQEAVERCNRAVSDSKPSADQVTKQISEINE